MADVSRAVRQAIQSRLSDSTNGFNAKYSAIESDYDTPDITIDWNDGSSNFAWGQIAPDLIEATSPFTYPVLTISAERGQQEPISQRIRFHQFSGMVLGMIQVHLSWESEEVVDFESWPDAVIDAMLASINDPGISPAWGTGVSFAGDLNWSKSPVIMAGENWRRTVTFTAAFKVIA